MTVGLPVSSLINVSVSLSPRLAEFANFDSLLILGDSDVIDVHERVRAYNTLGAVANDFGTSAPEYLAADLYFSQVPQPTTLYIGRWAESATSGLLVGGILSSAQQAIGPWQAITNGGFSITVDGNAPVAVTGLNFASDSNLNAVAATINAALVTASVQASVAWNGEQFVFTSDSTGTSSSVAFLTSPGSGTDISGTLRCSVTTASYSVNGIAAETALQAVVICDTAITTQWYGLMFAVPAGDIDDNDHLAVAGYIQGSGNPHMYGITTAETAALLSTDTTSIGYLLKQAGYTRTFTQWCSSSLYAVASMFGRMFTVDFAASNTTITLMYQQEPGVVAETLTENQAAALNQNNYNYFVNFNNETAIVVNGQVASGDFIDTIWGTDWLANQIQTNIYNALYGARTKIPQTDAGNHILATQIAAACNAGVENGLIAPGIWNAAGFGQLRQGDFLSKGYYVFAPPIASQPQNDRQARKSVPFQVAVKLAGAIQTADILVNVNA